MITVRYALSRTSDDRFPIEFREDCERTCCDRFGNSEGLLELMEKLDRAGYDLINSRDKLIEILEKRGMKL